MIYLITDNWRSADRWVRKELGKTLHVAIRDGSVLPLSTVVDWRSLQRLRGRTALPGDTVERIGRYEQGRYWHEIEDALKAIDRDGVLS